MKLYRFEKLEEGRCDTLVNKQLWLARPDTFEDEFDCRIAGLSMPFMSPESYRLLNEFLQNYYHAEFNYSDSILTKDFVEKLKEYISNSYAKDRLSANSTECIDAILVNTYLANFFKKNLFKPVGICCFFSGEPYDPKMWNNYADKQGYCIEYEYTQYESSSIRPVTYSSRDHWVGKYKGEVIKHFPYNIEPENVQPIYTEVSGWDEDLTEMSEASQLPKALNEYIEFLEKELEIPITIVSVGPDRKQTIFRQ